jgi:hypothetical protein
MADNERTFSPIWNNIQAPGPYHFLHDWAVIADALRGMHFDPDFAKPADLLATAVEDAHKLEQIGAKWYQPIPEDDFKDLDKEISGLGAKLRGLEYEHAWAIILVVQWYWDHQQDSRDIKSAPWWTLSYRRNWRQQDNEVELDRINMELKIARDEFQMSRACLMELKHETARTESASKEMLCAHEEWKEAHIRLENLRRESKSGDQKKARAQLEQARNEAERAQKRIHQFEAELVRHGESSKRLEEAEQHFEVAQARLKDLESKLREKMQVEREKAREELKRSEMRLEAVEDKIKELGSAQRQR